MFYFRVFNHKRADLERWRITLSGFSNQPYILIILSSIRYISTIPLRSLDLKGSKPLEPSLYYIRNIYNTYKWTGANIIKALRSWSFFNFVNGLMVFVED